MTLVLPELKPMYEKEKEALIKELRERMGRDERRKNKERDRIELEKKLKKMRLT